MSMGKKNNDYPPYMHDDGDRGGFVVRNPITGKKKRFTDAQKARDTAKALGQWVERARQIKTLDHGRPTISGLVAKWESDRLQFQPWDDGTRKNMLAKFRRISRELGSRIIEHTDCMYLEDWLTSFCNTADQFNKWRYALVLLWKFAVSRKLARECEPLKIELRSTSKKLAMNRKVREPLDTKGFWAIHEKAERWLQIAMEQSLVTLQGRSEICNMRHTDYRDGHLFVIRDKVSGDSDMAFIKIALTEELEDIRRRSLKIDGIVSPFLVHRAPDNRRRDWTEGKPHWTYVNPDYISKAFAEARDQVEHFKTMMPKRRRPTFHEIRGLGSRLYLEQGIPESAIQALMTHANKRTTRIYLEGGAEALTDNDFLAVAAPLRLRDVGIASSGD